jgi:hypothetical protein
MADERTEKPPGPGTNDTAEYSASKAPETRQHAEERAPDDVTDPRLIPGGAHGARADTGMHTLDRDKVPNAATDPGLTDYGEVDVTSKIDED